VVDGLIRDCLLASKEDKISISFNVWVAENTKQMSVSLIDLLGHDHEKNVCRQGCRGFSATLVQAMIHEPDHQ
jgi:hypothetical protein